ncbi:MAG: DUF3224 domain-containing protein [Gemmatimonadota bacterium]
MRILLVVPLITATLLPLSAPRASFSSVSLAHTIVSPVPTHARGTFEVQIAPLPADDYADAATLGRMTIDKQFSGDLTGTGKGQMLTGMGTTKGSAAYSAIERVTGVLAGRSGSFLLQHTGIMHDGAQQLTITIVPTSGTGDLAGISGTLAIIIEGKVHRYDLEYVLPAAH